MPKKGSSQVNNRNNKLTNLKVIVFLLNEFVSNFVQAEPKTIQNCKKVNTISEKNLPDGELNPGLPRDRRGYLPLYYRGWHIYL